MALRNEDYVAFLDESGEAGLQVVAGIFIPARWLRGAERRWQDFVRGNIGSRSGRVEIKSRELIAGESVALHAQQVMLANGHPPISAKGAGHAFYKAALEHIAFLAEVRILAVGVNSKYASDAYRLWFWLAYAALCERKTSPRPRLAMSVIDGEDAAFRGAQDLVAHRFHRAFWGHRYYVGPNRNAWFVGGSAHHDSALHPFIQGADLVAAAARHSIKGRAPYASWWRDHLCQPARNSGRAIDVSSHALKALRKMDPKDNSGSGHFGALVPK